MVQVLSRRYKCSHKGTDEIREFQSINYLSLVSPMTIISLKEFSILYILVNGRNGCYSQGTVVHIAGSRRNQDEMPVGLVLMVNPEYILS